MDNKAMNGQAGDSRDLENISPAASHTRRGVEPAAFARLKERSEFLAVAKGARMHEPAFTLQAIVRKADGPDRRFGLTVTKKTGNSVVRNRIRRRLREALRVSGLARDEVADGAAHDYVIVARRETLARPFASLKDDVARAVKRIDRRLAAQTAPPRKTAD
ncbi:MAG: rnpA [Hyphomicrobiales bacterium]|nr:rnpA [Hyphomicrobiales bacterium]